MHIKIKIYFHNLTVTLPLSRINMLVVLVPGSSPLLFCLFFNIFLNDLLVLWCSVEIIGVYSLMLGTLYTCIGGSCQRHRRGRMTGARQVYWNFLKGYYGYFDNRSIILYRSRSYSMKYPRFMSNLMNVNYHTYRQYIYIIKHQTFRPSLLF